MDRFFRLSALVLFVTILLITGCDSSKPHQTDVAPKLPPPPPFLCPNQLEILVQRDSSVTFEPDFSWTEAEWIAQLNRYSSDSGCQYAYTGGLWLDPETNRWERNERSIALPFAYFHWDCDNPDALAIPPICNPRLNILINEKGEYLVEYEHLVSGPIRESVRQAFLSDEAFTEYRTTLTIDWDSGAPPAAIEQAFSESFHAFYDAMDSLAIRRFGVSMCQLDSVEVVQMKQKHRLFLELNGFIPPPPPPPPAWTSKIEDMVGGDGPHNWKSNLIDREAKPDTAFDLELEEEAELPEENDG